MFEDEIDCTGYNCDTSILFEACLPRNFACVCAVSQPACYNCVYYIALIAKKKNPNLALFLNRTATTTIAPFVPSSALLTIYGFVYAQEEWLYPQHWRDGKSV
eukprot:scaffold196493_cov31-Attheya_sp.AAC.1